MECARSEPWRLGLCWQFTILYSCSLRSWPFLSWSSRSRIPVGHLLTDQNPHCGTPPAPPHRSPLSSLFLLTIFQARALQYKYNVSHILNFKFYSSQKVKNVETGKMSLNTFIYLISKIFQHLINVKITEIFYILLLL